jgi:hypothetical protein
MPSKQALSRRKKKKYQLQKMTGKQERIINDQCQMSLQKRKRRKILQILLANAEHI